MVPVAYLLYINGRTERANYLFDGMLEEMATRHRMEGIGTLDAFIHYARGDTDKAAAVLREAIDQQVFLKWWYYRGPIFDDMRADPGLNALLEEMEAEIVRQREWYLENRNKPVY